MYSAISELDVARCNRLGINSVNEQPEESGHVSDSNVGRTNRIVDGTDETNRNAITRTDFVSSMVMHELRGPAHAILSLLSIVTRERTGSLNPIQRDFLESALFAARRLVRLTHDLYSTMSLDRAFSTNCESTDFLSVVKRCCREFGPQLDEREVQLVLDVPHAGSWNIWADPIRLEQIVNNLIGNAARYAPSGTVVWLRLRQTRSRILCVVENQADVPPAENPAIWFEMFERGTRARDAHPTGVGLGLAIVKYLVLEHRGRVFARARRGSVSVAFTLPKQTTFSRVAAQNGSAAERT